MERNIQMRIRWFQLVAVSGVFAVAACGIEADARLEVSADARLEENAAALLEENTEALLEENAPDQIEQAAQIYPRCRLFVRENDVKFQNKNTGECIRYNPFLPWIGDCDHWGAVWDVVERVWELSPTESVSMGMAIRANNNPLRPLISEYKGKLKSVISSCPNGIGNATFLEPVGEPDLEFFFISKCIRHNSNGFLDLATCGLNNRVKWNKI